MSREEKQLQKLALKKELELIKFETGRAGSVVARRKSAKYNETSKFKEGETCLIHGYMGKVHLILGKGKRQNSYDRRSHTNYLVEVHETGIAIMEMTAKERKYYGCHPQMNYRIALEPWLIKVNN